MNCKFDVLFLTFSNNLLDPPYRSSIASTSSPEFNKESTVSAADNPEANAYASNPPSKLAIHISYALRVGFPVRAYS